MSSSPPRDPNAVPPTRSRRRSQPIETVLLASTACLLAAVAWPIVSTGLADAATSAPVVQVQTETGASNAPITDAPTMQIALLLDTSSSMDGLIDQARTKLWSVVNALDTATFHGDRPKLEIALYEYGNSSLDGEEGFIRQVLPFTAELDVVSEALFALRTGGGSEHAGQVIQRSVSDLGWRAGDGVLRVMYVAGNEPFTQGPVDYREAVAAAKERGVVVNTVHCGNQATGEASGWKDGAVLGGGRFLAIDHNHVAAYIATPQDEEIARLGTAMNETYVRFGAAGLRGEANLARQDDNQVEYGMASVVTRSLSKGSAYYRNESWDLVDALDGKKVALDDIDRKSLPDAIKDLDEAELEAHLQGKKAEREKIQTRLAELATERKAWLAEQAADSGGPDSLDDAIIASVREQATAAGFTLAE